MAVKFLDNLDLVGNQLENIIIDIHNSAPVSLGMGQLYMNVASSVSTLVLDKGTKGGRTGCGVDTKKNPSHWVSSS